MVFWKIVRGKEEELKDDSWIVVESFSAKTTKGLVAYYKKKKIHWILHDERYMCVLMEKRKYNPDD